LTQLAHEVGAWILVDAAQTAGTHPVRFHDRRFDLLACSGHKGLLGPLGTGIAVVRGGLEPRVDSLRQGGTGSESESVQQPERGEAKFEAGNLNVHGIAGLLAGIQFLRAEGPRLVEQQHQLRQQLYDGLGSLPGVTVYGPSAPQASVGVLSFNISEMDPHEAAVVLENVAHVQLRAGLHCAPRMHRTLGTMASGGTLRASLGPFNSNAHVRTLLDAVARLV
jgi:selenocysteine lyase/cysteine desulfurase